MGRIWHEWYHEFQPPWWSYVLPRDGGSDEYGRRVLILPIPPFGWVCIAWKTCFCEECTSIREQTARYEEEERHAQEDR